MKILGWILLSPMILLGLVASYFLITINTMNSIVLILAFMFTTGLTILDNGD